MLRNITQKRFFTGVVVLTIIFALVPGRALALSNTVYLSPSSGTSQIGDTFTVSVDGSVGWTLFGTYNVEGTLNFPSKILKVNSIDSSGATFTSSTSITPDNSAGKITFYQGNVFFGANNKKIHLFDITFQTLKSGTAKVAFGNVEYNTGQAATTGGSYNIPAPSPSPSPSPSPTPKPSPSPKPSPTQKPATKPPKNNASPAPVKTSGPLDTESENDGATLPADATAEEEEPIDTTEESSGGLVIEDVDVVANRQENYVKWKLNSEDATPSFAYGTSADSLEYESTVEKQDDGSYIANLQDLKLGTMYYFTIDAISADSAKDATYSSTLTTRGYPVQLTIKQNNLLLPNARVEINERTFTSNRDAIILTELADGEQAARVTSSGSADPFTIRFVVNKTEIPANGNPDLQSFTLNMKIAGKSGGLNSSLLTPILASIAVVIAIGSAIAFIIIRKKQAQQAYATSTTDSDLLAANFGGARSGDSSKIPRPQLQPPPSMQQYPTPAPTDVVQTADVETDSYDAFSTSQTADTENHQPTLNVGTPPPPQTSVSQSVSTEDNTDIGARAVPEPQYPVASTPENDGQSSQIITEDTDTSEGTTTENNQENIYEEARSDTYQPEQKNQTEAIYNQENGELEIIHHKGQDDSEIPTSTAKTDSTDIEQKNDSKVINKSVIPSSRAAVAK